ncbi:hypothetical protein ACIQ9Q_33700 [Streptomyces sp. NPDC094438]|uniref:hypothetical protein n=1 Tax=Streptomyces sp. NPDC094438 TaxID=3366061 RepID=UPI00382BAA7D
MVLRASRDNLTCRHEHVPSLPAQHEQQHGGVRFAQVTQIFQAGKTADKSAVLRKIARSKVQWLTSLNCSMTTLTNGPRQPQGRSARPADTPKQICTSPNTECQPNWSGYETGQPRGTGTRQRRRHGVDRPRIAADCTHGCTVLVTPQDTVRTGSVARAPDGTIIALVLIKLDVASPITAYVYRGATPLGQLTI